jgi:hypothetical protein
MKTRKAFVLISAALAIGWAVSSHAQTVVPPAEHLWLGFNNNLKDMGTSTNTHVVTLINPNGIPPDAVFTNDAANATCGTASEYFPGDGSCVEVTNVTDLNFNTGNPFTITAWIKTTNGGGVIAAKSLTGVIEGSGGTHTLAFYVQTDGTLRADVFYVGDVATAETVTNGEWTHVALTYDGASFQIWTNGAQIASGNPGGAANEGANGEGPWDFTVGATLNSFFPDDTPYEPFDGEIDEVAVWGLALSTNQIGGVYSNGVPPVTVNITEQPAIPPILFAGGTAAFAVAAEAVGVSGPVQYQWQSNGVNIASATNASYTTPPLTVSANGATYDCTMSVSTVVVDSETATLNVIAPSLASSPLLWLPFDGSLADLGISTNVHGVSDQPNPGYDGSFSTNVANSDYGSNSLSLPGDGSFIEVTNVSDLNFNTGNPFTITAWIDTATNGGVIAAKSLTGAISGGGGTHTLAFYLQTGGQLRVDVFYVNAVITAQTVPIGQWTHVAVSYDGGTTFSLFINGKLAATGSMDAANEGANSEGPWDFTVGATLNPFFPDDTGTGDPFAGLIEEVAVWDSALSPSQIGTVYLSGVPKASIDITEQPAAPPILIAGQTATFTVAAAAVGVSGMVEYQWQSNGVNIASATNATYTTPPLTASANGATYDCAISVGLLVVDSDAYALNVVTAVAPPQPVLWLPFNGSLADLGNSAVNPPHLVSGQPDPGYDGSFSANVANATCGSDSLSLTGDGSFIEVTNVSDLNFNTGNPFTITAWIDPAASGGVIAAKSLTGAIPGGGGTHTLAFYLETSGQLRVDLYYINTVITVQTITNGLWTHVAVTYDGGTTFSLFINGFLATTGSMEAANEGANGEGPWDFTVGATLNPIFPDDTGTGDPFDGLIDEVAVWKSALSEGQIYSVFTRGVQYSSPTLNVLASTNQLSLSWSAKGFVLQKNSSLTNSAGWSNVVGGGTSPVIVPIGTGSEFFRLVK